MHFPGKGKAQDMSQPQEIPPADLVPMDIFASDFPLRTDIVYADAAHPDNVFGAAVYRPGARLWLHRDFAAIVLLASRICHAASGAVFILKDGLRTVEAQQALKETPLVRANPWWSADGPNRLLAPPGKGAHPRGMAVDVVLEDEKTGRILDMGTSFDYLTTDPAHNPAARACTNFTPHILANRKLLEDSFVQAAKTLNRPLLPLPAEWWDFRFPPSVYDGFAPLSDSTLPPSMRMTATPGGPHAVADFPGGHFEGLKKQILHRLQETV